MKDSHSLTIGINQQFHAYGDGSIQGIIQEPITFYLIQNTLLHIIFKISTTTFAMTQMNPLNILV